MSYNAPDYENNLAFDPDINTMPRCDIEELKAENRQLKDIISKMCIELVDPDDDMSNGLAEYFNQDLLLEIREVLK
jgi:hypothetical protein